MTPRCVSANGCSELDKSPMTSLQTASHQDGVSLLYDNLFQYERVGIVCVFVSLLNKFGVKGPEVYEGRCVRDESKLFVKAQRL